MTVGSAIFWSTVLVIAAFAARAVTRSGKWRVVRTIIALIVGLSIVAALGIWGWSRYQERPIVTDELVGIRLGMKPVDVKLLKGAPFNEDTAVPEVKDGEASMVWGFRESYSDRVLVVHFVGPAVDSLGVAIVCERDGYSKLFGLGRYSRESDVIGKLGEPTRTSIDSNGLSKLISFKQWNVAFGVSKGVVNQVCVSSSGAVVYLKEYQ